MLLVSLTEEKASQISGLLIKMIVYYGRKSKVGPKVVENYVTQNTGDTEPSIETKLHGESCNVFFHYITNNYYIYKTSSLDADVVSKMNLSKLLQSSNMVSRCIGLGASFYLLQNYPRLHISSIAQEPQD